MYKSARRFYGQWLHFPPSAGARAELRGKGVWSREDADEMALFKDFLQNDVVPEVRSLENLDRYAENFGWVTVPEWAKNSEHRCFEMLPCAIARGAFDIARELAQIVEPYDDAYYQANVPGPVVDPTLFPPIRKLCQLLAVNDRKGMAEILHEMEEASITKSGLTHLWERTPFPIELMDA